MTFRTFFPLVSLFAICSISNLKALADSTDDARMGRPTFGQVGQLFTISLIPGDRLIQVQFTGKTLASVDPNRVTLLGKSYPRKGKPQDLNFIWTGSHFKILNDTASSDNLEIKIEDKITKKTEVFHLKRQNEINSQH